MGNIRHRIYLIFVLHLNSKSNMVWRIHLLLRFIPGTLSAPLIHSITVVLRAISLISTRNSTLCLIVALWIRWRNVSEWLTNAEQLFPNKLGFTLKGNLSHWFCLKSIVWFPFWDGIKLDEIINRQITES